MSLHPHNIHDYRAADTHWPAHIAPSHWSPRHWANELNAQLDHFFNNANQVQLRDHAAKLSVEKNGDFSYKVDASGFKPEELTVNVEGDEITVRGHHTESANGETVERSFFRRVRIPDGIHQDTIKSAINEKGHLSVEGKKVPAEQPNTRSIPIEYRASTNKAQ